MESDSNRLARLEHLLDATAGAQSALTVAISALLTPYRGNGLARASLEAGLESMRANLLGTSASDASIHMFDEIAETLLSKLS